MPLMNLIGFVPLCVEVKIEISNICLDHNSNNNNTKYIRNNNMINRNNKTYLFKK